MFFSARQKWQWSVTTRHCLYSMLRWILRRSLACSFFSTLPKFNSKSPWKVTFSFPIGSSSSHHFSGVMLNFGGVWVGLRCLEKIGGFGCFERWISEGNRDQTNNRLGDCLVVCVVWQDIRMGCLPHCLLDVWSCWIFVLKLPPTNQSG